MTGPATSKFMTAFVYIYFIYNFRLDLLPALPDGTAAQGLGQALLGAGAGGANPVLCSQPAAVLKTNVVGLSLIILRSLRSFLLSSCPLKTISVYCYSLKKPKQILP